jgi:DNA-binding CsgD family transcriptional regulator/pimeloyl-ACP methyl ester carboxylesterase
MDAPPVQYVKTSDGFDIAYAVSGAGPPLVFTGAGLMHLQLAWRMPILEDWLKALSEHFQLVQFDARGTGLSQRQLQTLSVEDYQRDLDVVLHQLGLDRFVLFGHSFLPTSIAAQYAVRNPERVSALILSATVSALTSQRAPALFTAVPNQDWDFFLRTIVEVANNPEGPQQSSEMLELFRQAYNQPDFLLMVQAANRFSLTDLLPKLTTPTLILTTVGAGMYPREESQKVARLARAQIVALDGRSPYGDPGQGLAAVESFLARLASQPETAASTSRGPKAAGLSDREVEVLRLLAQGKSNPQIAEALFITRNTVQNHVSSILTKTNLSNRAQAAVYARDHDLL